MTTESLGREGRSMESGGPKQRFIAESFDRADEHRAEARKEEENVGDVLLKLVPLALRRNTKAFPFCRDSLVGWLRQVKNGMSGSGWNFHAERLQGFASVNEALEVMRQLQQAWKGYVDVRVTHNQQYGIVSVEFSLPSVSSQSEEDSAATSPIIVNGACTYYADWLLSFEAARDKARRELP